MSGGGYVPSFGGAIANDYGYIDSITGDAIGNYIKTNGDGYGGFLYNQSYNPNPEPAVSIMSNSSFYNIGSINGNIISNHVMAYNGAYGGAISNFNYGSIAEINSDSISYNYVVYDDSFAQPYSIQPVNYDSFGEYYSGNAYGGAIYNEGMIGEINANISNNYAGAGYALGGAIFNNAKMGNVNGNITSNYTISEYISYGGAIYNNEGVIGDITGDIQSNYAISSMDAAGGFLYNKHGARPESYYEDSYVSVIGNITGNITGNYAKGESTGQGGAIYSEESKIGDITGDFSKNYAQGEWKA